MTMNATLYTLYLRWLACLCCGDPLVNIIMIITTLSHDLLLFLVYSLVLLTIKAHSACPCN